MEWLFVQSKSSFMFEGKDVYSKKIKLKRQKNRPLNIRLDIN